MRGSLAVLLEAIALKRKCLPRNEVKQTWTVKGKHKKISHSPNRQFLCLPHFFSSDHESEGHGGISKVTPRISEIQPLGTEREEPLPLPPTPHIQRGGGWGGTESPGSQPPSNSTPLPA
jgi:hypothetical protein